MPEKLIDVFNVAPGPSHLNGVTDSSFYPAGCGGIFLSDCRIEFLRDPGKQFNPGGYHEDSIPEVHISLDMCRDPKLVHNLGYPHVLFFLLISYGKCLRRRRVAFRHLSESMGEDV